MILKKNLIKKSTRKKIRIKKKRKIRIRKRKIKRIKNIEDIGKYFKINHIS